MNGRNAVIPQSAAATADVSTYQRAQATSAGHFIAIVAVARDFVSNVLYDLCRYQRFFFLEVEDYRAYRRANLRSEH
jgi:hypothetical protein